MSAAEHTPGPWQSSGLKVFVPDEDSARDLEYPVAWVQGTSAHEPEAAANARLIAAAPELLEALVKIADMTDVEADFDGFQARQIARTAIAKATGQ